MSACKRSIVESSGSMSSGWWGSFGLNEVWKSVACARHRNLITVAKVIKISKQTSRLKNEGDSFIFRCDQVSSDNRHSRFLRK